MQLSVCRYISRLVHQWFPSFSLQTEALHGLKLDLVYIFIIRITRSSLILGMNAQFLTDLCPLNLEKFLLFAVFGDFLLRGSTD